MWSLGNLMKLDYSGITNRFINCRVFLEEHQDTVKKEVKAVVSGIYITDVKGLHGKSSQLPKKKEGFFKRALREAQEKVDSNPKK